MMSEMNVSGIDIQSKYSTVLEYLPPTQVLNGSA